MRRMRRGSLRAERRRSSITMHAASVLDFPEPNTPRINIVHLSFFSSTTHPTAARTTAACSVLSMASSGDSATSRGSGAGGSEVVGSGAAWPAATPMPRRRSRAPSSWCCRGALSPVPSVYTQPSPAAYAWRVSACASSAAKAPEARAVTGASLPPPCADCASNHATAVSFAAVQRRRPFGVIPRHSERRRMGSWFRGIRTHKSPREHARKSPLTTRVR
mmetsp:Transcript_148843/g.414704  ORF Transcript_148843/g.414704 Transcript_148843/m.414704 type:complete len:219 (+) Transcript_148843:1172-1828(+)